MNQNFLTICNSIKNVKDALKSSTFIVNDEDQFKYSLKILTSDRQ